MIPRRLPLLSFVVLLLLPCCQASPGAPGASLVNGLLPWFQLFADGAVRLYLTDAANQHAPGLVAVLDTSGAVDQAGNPAPDGQLSLAEIMAADPADPRIAIVVLRAVERLLADPPAPPAPPEVPAGTDR